GNKLRLTIGRFEQARGVLVLAFAEHAIGVGLVTRGLGALVDIGQISVEAGQGQAQLVTGGDRLFIVDVVEALEVFSLLFRRAQRIICVTRLCQRNTVFFQNIRVIDEARIVIIAGGGTEG